MLFVLDRLFIVRKKTAGILEKTVFKISQFCMSLKNIVYDESLEISYLKKSIVHLNVGIMWIHVIIC